MIIFDLFYLFISFLSVLVCFYLILSVSICFICFDQILSVSIICFICFYRYFIYVLSVSKLVKLRRCVSRIHFKKNWKKKKQFGKNSLKKYSFIAKLKIETVAKAIFYEIIFSSLSLFRVAVSGKFDILLF